MHNILTLQYKIGLYILNQMGYEQSSISWRRRQNGMPDHR
jgi:hypothetical protein